MNFEIVTNSRFKIGIDFYKRIYQAKLLSDGTVNIFNIYTGKTLFNNLDLSTTSVNGQPATFENLQEIIYNFECTCNPDLEDTDYKIFDESFDNTFE